jgi:organic hydroperoxide reductase OsmC/OhrA
MASIHHFEATVTWTGNQGTGTSTYRAYSRNYEVTGDGKSAAIAGSSAPAFRGDKSRYNPEDLMIASLSACHMLWVLHLCAEAKITVVEYVDTASGTMVFNPDGSGQFSEVVLRPRITVMEKGREADIAAINERSHRLCFIARSVNFPVRHEALVVVRDDVGIRRT